jgi:hypothetical protein
VEQPQPRRTEGPVTVSLERLCRKGAFVGALLVLAGCWKPTQRAVIEVPAAQDDGEGRPMRILVPVALDPKSNDAMARPQDAIVRVVSDVTCTGTLIADDRVLTAHHCVSARDKDGHVLDRNIAPGDIEIELGGDYLAWGEVRVRAIVAPDCGYTMGDGDIAILVLTRHLIGMPTWSPRIEAPPEPGQPLVVYGFGRCVLAGEGIHRVGRDADDVAAVSPGQFTAPAAICPGDSGGPAQSRGELVGVVSASVMDPYGKTKGKSVFTRIDVWPQLFSAAHEISLGASPGELPPYGDCRAQGRAPVR